MQLFEVVRWGNDLDDPHTGGPDGPDTCFLVHAVSVERAAALVDQRLALSACERAKPYASAVYLLSAVAPPTAREKIIRGPYVQHAHCHGWRNWHRDTPAETWAEKR